MDTEQKNNRFFPMRTGEKKEKGKARMLAEKNENKPPQKNGSEEKKKTLCKMECASRAHTHTNSSMNLSLAVHCHHKGRLMCFPFTEESMIKKRKVLGIKGKRMRA